MVHPQGLTAEERQLVAESKTPYSTAPVIEMSYSAVRSGYIQYAELTELGVQLGLSIDSSGASANADFFNVMRALMWSDWQRSGSPQKLKPRRLVELATIDGARLLGPCRQDWFTHAGKAGRPHSHTDHGHQHSPGRRSLLLHRVLRPASKC